jgi:UDP-glucose 4-epimerase
LPLAMNVGTSRGGSVREVIQLVCEAAGHSDVVAEEKERRAGDPAFLCADINKMLVILNKTSRFSLEKSIRTLFSI